MARLRRTSVPVYGRTRSHNVNNDGSSDGSGSIASLHRDPLHRRNILIWRDHWQPESANRLSDADGNNNGTYTAVILSVYKITRVFYETSS